MLLNHQWITEVKEEIKRYLETNENINTIILAKPLGCNKSSSMRDVYSSKVLPEETRKISNNLPLYPKQLQKEQKNPNTQSNQRKNKQTQS